MNKILVYLFFSCLFFSNVIIAQHPVYMHLTEKDGLPDVEFYDILEDKEGMIWLAADKGLFSYDGKNFKNFSHFQKRGLSVFGLKLDVQGRVWCNNLSGQVFYVEKDSLVLFHDFQNDVKGQLAEFKFFNNKVIVSTEKGIYELDKKGLFKKKISKTARLMPTSIKGDTLLSFANDQIFVTTINKKASIQYDLSKYKKYDFNKWEIASLKNNDLIYASSSKSLKTKPRLFYGDGKNLKEVVLPKELKGDNVIMKFYNVKDDLWVCTKKGVFIYQIINGRLNYRKTYFEDIPVSRFLKDRNNNYWFTTLTNGVFIIPNLYISKYNIEKRKENITAVSKMSNNTLMMGSVKGDLAFLNKETNKLKYLKNTIKQRVYTITEDKDNLYLSLSKASLIYDKKNNQIIRDNFLYNAKDVTFLDKENILYSTHRTASIININSREEIELKATRATVVFYSSRKQKYIAYIEGVEKYNQENKSEKLFFNNQSVFANDITETSSGIVWISTLKDGVIGYEKGLVVKQYSKKNGLLSNQVDKIKGDGLFLWISTDKGIQLLNTKTDEIKSLTRKDGINSFNITEFIPFKNTLFFSSNKGLFKVDKEKVFKDKKILDFYFTSIEVNDKEIPQKDIYVFDSNVRKIKFSFHTNGFLSQDDIVYKYYLNETSKTSDWSEVDKGVNQVTFNNLASGNYVFKLKATSGSGLKETKEKVVKITISPPLYKQWWFLILLIVFFITVFWYIFSTRLRIIKKKQQQALVNERMQKELVASKLTTLQAQMNPHFTFNALNSIQNLVLKGDKQNAYNYLAKFSSLLRESLTLSTKSFVFFEEELSVLKKYLELEKLRFREKFSYQIMGEELIDTIKIPTMIIQPFVENAIKHGLLHKLDSVGEIKIEFFQDELFTCVITDNGVGKLTETVKTEKGTTLKEFKSTGSIKNKLKILKDYYKLDIGFTYQKVPVGTKVIIKIPYTSMNE